MEKTQVYPNYEVWQFDTQTEYFQVLEELLQKDYKIVDTIHLCVEVCKDDKKILLSFIELPQIDEHLKENIIMMQKDYKLVRPNFRHCLLNTIASIRKSFGKEVKYDLDEQMSQILQEKKYQNIIILLLDGLGVSILEQHLEPDAFLRTHYLYTNTAIYPSTTAASTTATINGLAPICTAWLGWENYFKEIDRNIILFTGVNYVTDEYTGFVPSEALPYEPFYQDLPVCGQIIQPDFKIYEYPFSKVLERSLKQLDAKRTNIQYLYFTEPDGLLHKTGTKSDEVAAVCKQLNDEVASYAKKLPEDTILIVSADHGHTDVQPIDLYACPTIQKMLKRRPSNDARCITFSVKEEYKQHFKEIFTSLFGYAYDIYDSQELIDREFFGTKNDVPNPRSYEFLADFVAVATKDYYFNYKKENDIRFKSHHAGITADEMLVPVIVYRK